MALKTARRGLGRGLAALIPESDFDLLNTVARGEIAPAPVAPAPVAPAPVAPAPVALAPVAPAPVAPVNGKLSDAPRSDSPQKETSPAATSKASAVDGADDIRYLPIETIEPNPFQPRQIFSEEELENLAASVKEHGVLQPILVRPLPDSTKNEANIPRFQLIAGERRWRAATRAKLGQIPAIVRAVDDKSALELAIIENVQRHDISAVESAQAYRRLAKEFGLTGEQIAGRVGKSRASVANTMRLLDLPPEAIGALRENLISEGHGRALLTANTETARRTLLKRTLRDGLSVRDVERLSRESNEAGDDGKASQSDAPKLQRAAASDMARLELTLQRALGARLKLKARRRGGQIVIDFSSPEELNRLVRRMTKPEKNDGQQ